MRHPARRDGVIHRHKIRNFRKKEQSMNTHTDTLCPKCREMLGTSIGAFFRSAAMFHMFLVVCTLGLWIPAWIWIVLNHRKLGICAECGGYVDPSREMPVPEQPEEPVPPAPAVSPEANESWPKAA
jgi:hypothetical protein